ncbi:hypothetical protein [Micromonospora deserti]|uniref:Uncharacterized protein n=1 Tax=Micromonospora deserti TaxID=2070366 RepID=A0A2W2C3I6_9ACTN|nr:hypothetical protein [Micromonospora deserti]PZF87284.1 hypothetical protein C1I99_27755 [Micromonospora deserti]
MRDHGTEETSSMTTEETGSTTRRRIIKAGVAAGAGVGAAAVVATPASADPGNPVILGTSNSALDTETLLTGGSSANPALALRSPAGKAPLVLTPTSDPSIPNELPTGSLAVTNEGDLVIGGRGNTKAYVNTSRWANSTVAVPPRRILDSRAVPTSTTYDPYIAGLKSSVDSTGKMKAGSTIHLSVSGLPLVQPGQALSVFVNITVAATVSSGFLKAYSSSIARPETSSLNWWGPNQILSNLVEVQLGSYSGRGYSFAIWVQTATALIVDVSGLVLSKPAA